MLDGHVVDKFVVVVNTLDKGLVFILVDAHIPGIIVEWNVMMDSCSVVIVQLDNVEVSIDVVLDEFED